MNEVKHIIKKLASLEGVALLLLAFMLLTKIYGDGRYMILTIMMCVCIVPLIRRQYFDSMSLKIIVFSSFYALTMFFHKNVDSNFFLLYLAVSPVFFYLFGKVLIDKAEYESDLIFVWWVLALCLGAVVFYTIDFTGTIHVGVEESGRVFKFSDNDEQGLSATLIAVFVSLGLTGLGNLIFVVEKMRDKLLWLLLFILSLSANVFFINRTGLLVSILVLLAMAYYKGKKSFFSVLRIVIPISLFSLILYWIGFVDVNVLDSYSSRSEESSTALDRFNRWGLGIQYMFQYPFGWAHRREVFDGFIHNMWLDSARKGGIICFILLVSLTYSSIKTLLHILHYKKSALRLFFLGLYVCFFCSCLVEPIIDSLPQYMMLFMLLWGMMQQYNLKKTNNFK